MLPAAGKGERRNPRGSARLSSKMSGKPPRLRILRPRPQQRAGSDSGDVPVAEETSRPEGNLKEIERDGRKRDARAASGTKAAAMASEMEDEDEDNNDEEEEEEELVTAAAEEEDEQGPIDGDLVVAEKSEEEVIELETNERNSYECKSCKPPRTLPNIKAYLEHLRKEHKQKVREDPERDPPALPEL